MARATFAAAVASGFAKPYFKSTPCYMAGPLAVHRSPWGLFDDRDWCVSHAATGLSIPGVKLPRMKDAKIVAERMATAVDWRQVLRGDVPGSVRGLSPEMAIKAREARDSALADIGFHPLPAFCQETGR